MHPVGIQAEGGHCCTLLLQHFRFVYLSLGGGRVGVWLGEIIHSGRVSKVFCDFDYCCDKKGVQLVQKLMFLLFLCGMF